MNSFDEQIYYRNQKYSYNIMVIITIITAAYCIIHVGLHNDWHIKHLMPVLMFWSVCFIAFITYRGTTSQIFFTESGQEAFERYIKTVSEKDKRYNWDCMVGYAPIGNAKRGVFGIVYNKNEMHFMLEEKSLLDSKIQTFCIAFDQFSKISVGGDELEYELFLFLERSRIDMFFKRSKSKLFTTKYAKNNNSYDRFYEFVQKYAD